MKTYIVEVHTTIPVKITQTVAAVSAEAAKAGFMKRISQWESTPPYQLQDVELVSSVFEGNDQDYMSDDVNVEEMPEADEEDDLIDADFIEGEEV